MIFISVLIQCIYSLITYDTGLFNRFNRDVVSSFVCANGTSYTETVSFSSPFANPPQIILYRERSDISNTIIEGTTNTYQQIVITFKIQSVTTTSFQFYIKCNSNRVYGINYRWLAIDDQRVQVLSIFNHAYQEIETFNHSNPNAVEGFVSLVSESFKGPLFFNITIDSITSTQATIKITNPQSYNGNILSLGYQIILTEPEFVNKIATIYKQASWTSSNIPVLPNTIFLIPLQGFNYQNTDSIRLRCVNVTTNPISYKYETWYGTYPPNTHMQVQLYYSFNSTYPPLICNHLRIISKSDPFVNQANNIILNILETSQSISQNIAQTIVIEKTFNVLTFLITIQCTQIQKVISSFYFLQSEQQFYKSQTKYCYSESNFIIFNSRFQQQKLGSEELQIQKTQSSLSIDQIQSQQYFLNFHSIIIYSQVKSSFPLVSIQIDNI